MKNPAWKSALKKLVQQAAESLGVTPSLVAAELYKLLLYEEGGFFKKHRDTEKADGMFATLVAQLPSNFTGGSFVVSHGGESESFSLGAGSEAAYGCHFVCHYADCEHEIKKVESGHRLALIYSLCYSGPYKPSASDVGHTSLSTVLQGLPADESMFFIPLEHQYTTASLARLGAGALKGSDRAKQNAIEIAGKGGWKTIVAQAERTDYESGDGSYWGGFEVCVTERGSIDLSNAYNSDGSDADYQLKWIRMQVSFDSVEEGGMFLVSSEDLEEDDGRAIWGEGDEGNVEYTGNEGATRETTYSMYLMIVFSEKSGFERMCASDFSSAVTHVVSEESAVMLRRMLSYVKTKKPSIKNADCIELLQAIRAIDISEQESLDAYQSVVGSLAVTELPSTELTEALISSAEHFGWTSASDPVKAYSAKLAARKDLNMADFLKVANCFLRMQTASGSTDFDAMLDQKVKDFETRTTNQSPASNYGGYSYGYRSNYNSSTQASADALVSLSQHHPREKTKPVVQACIARLRKQDGNSTDKLGQRANLLQWLRSFHDSSDVENWYRGVVDDFVTTVEKLPSSRPRRDMQDLRAFSRVTLPTNSCVGCLNSAQQMIFKELDAGPCKRSSPSSRN